MVTLKLSSLVLFYYSRAKVGREPILRSSFCIAQWSVGVDWGPRKERGAKFLFFRRHGDLRRDRSFRLLFELGAKDKQGDHVLFNTHQTNFPF